MKKIGLFGGTFDPIHFGHINLAVQLCEKHRLDEVIFYPVSCSPFKRRTPPRASPEQRLAMIEMAIHEIPLFRVSPFEIEKGGISYTIDTLKYFYDLFSLGERFRLFLLLSDDAVPSFHQWKSVGEIVRIAQPLVGIRGDALKIPLSPVHAVLRRHLTPILRMDISSTIVRQRVRQGLYCGQFVPDPVLKYIYQEGIYQKKQKKRS